METEDVNGNRNGNVNGNRNGNANAKHKRKQQTETKTKLEDRNEIAIENWKQNPYVNSTMRVNSKNRKLKPSSLWSPL